MIKKFDCFFVQGQVQLDCFRKKTNYVPAILPANGILQQAAKDLSVCSKKKNLNDSKEQYISIRFWFEKKNYLKPAVSIVDKSFSASFIFLQPRASTPNVMMLGCKLYF